MAQARTEYQEAQRQGWQHIQWNHPDVAWATDASEYARDEQGQKLCFVATQDLSSSFRFAPLCTLGLEGQAIAEYLEGLFERNGAPLMLKRDNGSIFNNAAVDEVLSRWHAPTQ